MSEKLSCYGEKPVKACEGCCWHKDCSEQHLGDSDMPENFELYYGDLGWNDDYDYEEYSAWDDYSFIDSTELNTFQELTGFIGNHENEDKGTYERAIAEYMKRYPEFKFEIGEPYLPEHNEDCFGIYQISEKRDLSHFWNFIQNYKNTLGEIIIRFSEKSKSSQGGGYVE